MTSCARCVSMTAAVLPVTTSTSRSTATWKHPRADRLCSTLETARAPGPGTSAWTADYNAGRFTFTADTAGTVYYLTGRSYDVYAAASELWSLKAAHVAERFDFTVDDASFSASKLIDQYEKMAAKCLSQSATGGIHVSQFYRDDVNTLGTQPFGYTVDRD